MSASDPGHWPTRTRALAAVAVAVLAALLVRFGWDRGPDVLIDFGRELYVPWRLTLGEVLHRDIAWFNGPLGPWLLAAWMDAFGVSLDAVQALNACVIAAATLLLAWVLARIADDLTAATGAVVFLCVFAVAQQEEVGNFLFLAPYSHGATLGFLCGVGALLALADAAERGTARTAALAGLLAGAAFLTKAEVFLAVACALLTILAADLPSAHAAGRRARTAGAVALGFALPLVAAWLRLRGELETGAGRALLGTWPHAFDERVSELKFYVDMRGADDPSGRLTAMGLQTLGSLAFVALVSSATIALARVAAPLGRVPTSVLACAVGAIALLAALTRASIEWLLLPLPIVLVVLGATSLVALRRARTPSTRGRAVLRLGFVVFAGALLPKVALLPLARQYGFVLAVPGTLLCVAALVRWIPSAVVTHGRAHPGTLSALRAAGVGVALAFAAANLNATRNWFERKTTEFGTAADRLWSDGYRGTVLNELARDLDARVPDDGTLLVLPEGIHLNYHLRRRTPTRVVNFLPPELLFFDAESIVKELTAHPPDAIALVRRPTDVYGPPFFGEGYGEPILDWVHTHYHRVRLIGDEPFGDHPKGGAAFGAAILIPR